MEMGVGGGACGQGMAVHHLLHLQLLPNQAPPPLKRARAAPALLLCCSSTQAKDLAALCCSCTPMRHRASTDNLWKPLFDREFPLPADQQQQQQAQPPPAQQQQQPAQASGAARTAPAAAATNAASSSAGASSSKTQPQQQQQQQQEPPLHARLAYLLSHGQRYSLRHSLNQLRQEAGRRGWKWAFGAAWTQRARLLAEAERNR